MDRHRGRGGADPDLARRPRRPRRDRRPPAPPVPAAELVAVQRARRRGHRRTAHLAHRRRQHIGRRLHPDDVASGRRRGIYGQLLPLVRRARGPVRLVLPDLRLAGARHNRQPVDAPTGAGLRHPGVAHHLSRGVATTRTRGRDQPGRPVDCRVRVHGVVVPVQQRPASRTDHLPRRTPDLVFGRTCDRHRTDPSGGGGLHHRRVQPRSRPDRPDGRGGVDRRGQTDGHVAHQEGQGDRRRPGELSGNARTGRRGRGLRDLRGVLRPDPGRLHTVDQHEDGPGPLPELVQRVRPLHSAVRNSRQTARWADASQCWPCWSAW